MYLCVDGNLDGKSRFTNIDMEAVYCDLTCPNNV